MQKPESLRSALKAALPEIRDTPDRLTIWVEDGAVRARQTEGHGFSFEYPLSVLLREMSTNVAVIAHAINRWLRRHQPARMAGSAGDSYTFETDILTNGNADVLFTIRLSEQVDVKPQDDGSWLIEYETEPAALFNDDALPSPLEDPADLAAATIVLDPQPDQPA